MKLRNCNHTIQSPVTFLLKLYKLVEFTMLPYGALYLGISMGSVLTYVVVERERFL